MLKNKIVMSYVEDWMKVTSVGTLLGTYIFFVRCLAGFWLTSQLNCGGVLRDQLEDTYYEVCYQYLLILPGMKTYEKIIIKITCLVVERIGVSRVFTL